MNEIRKTTVNLVILLALIFCSTFLGFAQTPEETLRAAEKAFNEAVELSETNKKELIPLVLEKFRIAQNLYHKIDSKREEANSLRGIGRSYLQLNDRNEAIKAYQEALRLFEEISRTNGIANVLFELGDIYVSSNDKKELELALDYYEKARKLFVELNDPNNKEREGNASYNTADIYSRLGNRQKTIETFRRALTIYQEIDDKEKQAATFHRLGVATDASIEIGDKRQALDYYQKAVALYRSLKDKNIETGYSLNGIATIFIALGNREEAIKFCNEAIAAYEAGGADQFYIALTKENLGLAYALGTTEKDLQQALNSYLEAARIYKQKNNKPQYAAITALIGDLYVRLKNKEEALKSYKQSLAIFQELAVQDEVFKQSIMKLFDAIGNLFFQLGNRDETIKFFKETLAEYQKSSDKFYIALMFSHLGRIYTFTNDEKDIQIALDNYLEATRLYQEKQDKLAEAYTLANIGDLYFRLKNKEQTLQFYKKAQTAFQELSIKDPTFKRGIAKGFAAIGATYEYMGDEKEKLLASENYRKAQAIYQEFSVLFANKNEKTNQIQSLRDLADVFFRTKNRGEAIKIYQQTITVCQEIRDEHCESMMVNAIANAYYDSETREDNLQAVKYYRTAQKLFRKSGDKNGEIWALQRITSAQELLNEWQSYLETCSELLEVAKTLEPNYGEVLKAQVYLKIGNAQQVFGNNKAAAESFELAYSISNRLKAVRVEADALKALVLVYFILGEPGKVLDKSERLLSILNSADNDYSRNKGFIHTMRGYAYDALGDRFKSNEELQTGLQFLQKVDDTEVADFKKILTGNSYLVMGQEEIQKSQFKEIEQGLEAIKDNNAKTYALYYLALSYMQSDDKVKALDYAKKSLLLSQKTNNRTFEAVNYLLIGFIKGDIGESNEAVASFQQAIIIFQELNAQLFEVYSLGGLMMAWRDAKNPRLAIFYGKQAVRLFEKIRINSKNLDTELQKSYLQKVSVLYKGLVEILIAQGRLNEAQQVINLSRDQEFFDLGSNQTPTEIQFTQSEDENDLLWKTESDKVRKALKEFDSAKLNQTESSGTESITKVQQLEISYKKSYDEYLSALKNIGETFKQPPGEKDKLLSVTDITNMQTALSSINTTQKTAVLYTFIGEDKFYVLLNTFNEPVKIFESSVEASDLNRKLLQFYALLQSKVYDPRRLGKIIYDIIIPKPLEDELKARKIQTLMWSLEGNLRYIPMATLSPDGTHYLVESYNNVVFTRADTERITRKVSSDWTGYGFFTSVPHSIELSGESITLPSLDKNEKQIFRTKTYSGGIIDGDIYPDDKFTAEALTNISKQKRPLVHISSHFVFYPGNSELSFLLLGNGAQMPLSKMKEQLNIFQDVELLTLSACETAAQFPNADGKEIDGFAELAQRLGAGSVMASLWSVADVSTTQLMKGFYKNRQTDKLNKAEALRKVQLDFLYGRNKIMTDLENTKGNSAINKIAVDAQYLIDFNDKNRLAHPYYWSPFVLFGNWK